MPIGEGRHRGKSERGLEQADSGTAAEGVEEPSRSGEGAIRAGQDLRNAEIALDAQHDLALETVGRQELIDLVCCPCDRTCQRCMIRLTLTCLRGGTVVRAIARQLGVCGSTVGGVLGAYVG